MLDMITPTQGSRGVRFKEPIIVLALNDTGVDRNAGQAMAFDISFSGGNATNLKEDNEDSGYYRLVAPSTAGRAHAFVPTCILKEPIAAGGTGLVYICGRGIPGIVDAACVPGQKFGIGAGGGGGSPLRLDMSPAVGDLIYGWAEGTATGAGQTVPVLFNGWGGVGVG